MKKLKVVQLKPVGGANDVDYLDSFRVRRHSAHHFLLN